MNGVLWNRCSWKVCYWYMLVNPLSINPTKWSNTLKQFVGNLPTNCLSVFDRFVKFMLKGLRRYFFSKVASCRTAALLKMNFSTKKILLNTWKTQDSLPYTSPVSSWRVLLQTQFTLVSQLCQNQLLRFVSFSLVPQALQLFHLEE